MANCVKTQKCAKKMIKIWTQGHEPKNVIQHRKTLCIVVKTNECLMYASTKKPPHYISALFCLYNIQLLITHPSEHPWMNVEKQCQLQYFAKKKLSFKPIKC